MLKWRQVVIWPAVFILVVDISTSAHCAVARPSRSVVKSGTTTARNAASTINDTSSRVVARSATTAPVQKNAFSMVQPDVSVGIPGFLTRVV